jgi:arylsulfatase A-like enzyme
MTEYSGGLKPAARSLAAGGVRIGALLLIAALLSCAPGEEAASPNIVLIVVDALRPDHLGCYGYERPTSPFLDGLAARSIVFDNAISHAPWTKTSFSTMMTSLYPFQHGVTGWESVMPDSFSTLPEVLQDHGYSTMAVVNMLGISDRFRVLSGVDTISASAKTDRDAVRTTDDAIALMKDSRKPFFIVIHYFDVHWPYRPPVAYVDRVRLEGDPDPLALRSGRGRQAPRQSDEKIKPDEGFVKGEMLMYDGCIRLVDDNIARLFAFLEEAGLREDTAVFITADHGEAFWEHGFGSHGYDLHEESIRVPLILSYPARYGEPARVEAQVGHIDLLPTILDFARIRDDAHREGASLDGVIADGQRVPGPGSLLPGDLLLAESSLRKAPDSRCIRSNSYKAIIEPATSLLEIYDLREDPGETENLRDSAVAVGDSLAGLLMAIPGSRVNGWRIGFTGRAADARYRAEVRVLDGGRLTGADRVVAGGEFSLEVAPDSTGFALEVRPAQQQIVLFDVAPRGARVRFEISAGGPRAPTTLFLGGGARAPLGRVVTLSNKEAAGPAPEFEAFRDDFVPGAFVWWLPGGHARRQTGTTDLTPEEVKRLKSLGYIQ